MQSNRACLRDFYRGSCPLAFDAGSYGMINIPLMEGISKFIGELRKIPSKIEVKNFYPNLRMGHLFVLSFIRKLGSSITKEDVVPYSFRDGMAVLMRGLK